MPWERRTPGSTSTLVSEIGLKLYNWTSLTQKRKKHIMNIVEEEILYKRDPSMAKIAGEMGDPQCGQAHLMRLYALMDICQFIGSVQDPRMVCRTNFIMAPGQVVLEYIFNTVKCYLDISSSLEKNILLLRHNEDYDDEKEDDFFALVADALEGRIPPDGGDLGGFDGGCWEQGLGLPDDGLRVFRNQIIRDLRDRANLRGYPVRQDSTHIGVFFSKVGTWLFSKGQYERARTVFTQEMDICLTHAGPVATEPHATHVVEAHRNMALCLTKLGELEAAQEQCELMLKVQQEAQKNSYLFTDISESEYMIGVICSKRGNHKAALKWLHRALDYRVDHVAAVGLCGVAKVCRTVGLVYRKLKSFDLAETVLDQASGLLDNNKSLWKDAYITPQKYEKLRVLLCYARVNLDRAELPKEVNWKSRVKSALAYLDQAHELMVNKPGAKRSIIAKIYRLQGDAIFKCFSTEGKGTFSHADFVEKYELSLKYFTPGRATHGRMLRRMRPESSSTEPKWLKKCLALDSQRPRARQAIAETQLHLAHHYESEHDYPAARFYYERGIVANTCGRMRMEVLDPNHTGGPSVWFQVYVRFGRMLLNMGQYGDTAHYSREAAQMVLSAKDKPQESKEGTAYYSSSLPSLQLKEQAALLWGWHADQLFRVHRYDSAVSAYEAALGIEKETFGHIPPSRRWLMRLLSLRAARAARRAGNYDSANRFVKDAGDHGDAKEYDEHVERMASIMVGPIMEDLEENSIPEEIIRIHTSQELIAEVLKFETHTLDGSLNMYLHFYHKYSPYFASEDLWPSELKKAYLMRQNAMKVHDLEECCEKLDECREALRQTAQLFLDNHDLEGADVVITKGISLPNGQVTQGEAISKMDSATPCDTEFGSECFLWFVEHKCLVMNRVLWLDEEASDEMCALSHLVSTDCIQKGKGRGDVLLSRGIKFVQQRLFWVAIPILVEAMEANTTNSESHQFYVHTYLAQAYEGIGHYEEAEKFYLRMIETLEEQLDKVVLSKSESEELIQIHVASFMAPHFDAPLVLDRAIMSVHQVYIWLCRMYEKWGKIDARLEALTNALRILEEGENGDMRTTTYFRKYEVLNQIGEAYLEKGDRQTALEFFMKALNNGLLCGPRSLQVMESYTHISNVHRTEGRYDEAIQNCEKALRIATLQCGRKSLTTAQALCMLARVHISKGDFHTGIHDCLWPARRICAATIAYANAEDDYVTFEDATYHLLGIYAQSVLFGLHQALSRMKDEPFYPSTHIFFVKKNQELDRRLRFKQRQIRSGFIPDAYLEVLIEEEGSLDPRQTGTLEDLASLCFTTLLQDASRLLSFSHKIQSVLDYSRGIEAFTRAKMVQERFLKTRYAVEPIAGHLAECCKFYNCWFVPEDKDDDVATWSISDILDKRLMKVRSDQRGTCVGISRQFSLFKSPSPSFATKE